MSRTLRLVAVLSAALLQAAAPVAWSQTMPTDVQSFGLAGGPGSGTTMRIDLAGGGASQSLSLPKGKSAIIELPVDARDVLVTNPTVADAVLRTERRIYVLGLKEGQTDAVFFDAAGRRILSLNIRVDTDVGALADTIQRVIPGSRIKIEPINDSVILTGLVLNAADSANAQAIATQFVDKPEKVINLLQIAAKDQVMLKVRVIEVQRSVIKQLGFDASSLVGKIGDDQISFAQSATFGVNGALLGGLTASAMRDTTTQAVLPGTGGCDTPTNTPSTGNPADCVATGRAGSGGLAKYLTALKAFERVGLVRTLAETTLTSTSGEAARMLAGGEFPVPTGQDTTGKVTIEFKPYGVGLGFTPIVLSGGRISMKVSVEVSELTNTGSFTLATGTGSSLTIPGLNVRRAENTVELPSGGAMMIAGLLQERTAQNLDSVPGLMTAPVVGALLRSRDFLSGQTELVIIATPYIVDPSRPQDLQTPADGLLIANDFETVLLGKLNKTVKAPPGANADRTYQGPVGYVIE
ncbi:pilus assembly protein CpaC [Caulobacter ginsengisoli]|uniref:Pilus assembly protein CpaC n=1 Tax=Caulobacter ginsengisoli TaxID=400775 RepID=A0ABU0IYK8_9CAUL|nr:type II and III secretion system protein family protein [Caulobacter ginsengisoli]MDQ0466440.1 pilus assembly protein CpaC [Caulobacter ginsengisoli]